MTDQRPVKAVKAEDIKVPVPGVTRLKAWPKNVRPSDKAPA